MTEPATAADPRVALAVESEAAAHDVISANLVAALMVLWAGFSTWYAGDAVAALGQRMAQLVAVGQRQSARITEAYLRQQMRMMDIPLPFSPIVDLPPDLRLGAETADVYQRPVREIRYLESIGVPLEEAVERATERLEKQALTDLQIARTNAAQQVFYQSDERVIGYRRIIHPELGNVCGLCIAASDRIYSRKQLLPLHPACRCTSAPVTASNDPGRTINAEDLARIYEAAGGTTESRALSKTRFEIKQNGELGPVLTPVQVKMRGPAQVRRQLSDRAAEMRRQQLERQIRDIQSRGRLSQWHQDRLEQLQELFDAA